MHSTAADVIVSLLKDLNKFMQNPVLLSLKI